MNNTHPIGAGTDNVSVNMPKELHSRLGREAARRGYRSKCEFIREAILKLLKESATLCVALGLWGAAALIGAESVCGFMDDARRGNSRVPRVVRVIRKAKGGGLA